MLYFFSKVDKMNNDVVQQCFSNFKRGDKFKHLCNDYGYYCATRMHSADYAVARCLSVRLSHAGIVPNGYTYPQRFFTVG